MRLPLAGGIDCDVHIAPPSMRALLPHLDAYWREQMVNRGLDRVDFTLASARPRLPIAARPDSRGNGGELDTLRARLLDPLQLRTAICHALHGAIALHTEDMAAALCRAVNDWVAAEWLDREPRLRGSILLPLQNVELAVAEIERRAADQRFVQVLALAMVDQPLGRRHYWPVWAAAERHGLPLAIHAGSLFRHAPSATGWPSFHVEDHVLQAQAFDAQLASLIAEGAFQKFAALKVVLLESGLTWLPTFIWRMNKIWRGLRAEVPWVKQPPGDIIRDRVRVTLQPVDAPDDPQVLARTLDHIGAERMLLFSSDWPHWHDDRPDPIPDGVPDALARRMLLDNPAETYPRLSLPAARATEAAR
ncbi:amidohydrolase family protein [Falsiroseomonas oryzae]|uniref:amidohydrolase family protein n=1 Tax=Falsiroseomonas oryzae TaxID=2766473 RepID=UPI0022EA912C|nr:amidohydrolase family protein [Roseomonas sp. MO-31]